MLRDVFYKFCSLLWSVYYFAKTGFTGDYGLKPSVLKVIDDAHAGKNLVGPFKSGREAIAYALACPDYDDDEDED